MKDSMRQPRSEAGSSTTPTSSSSSSASTRPQETAPIYNEFTSTHTTNPSTTAPRPITRTNPAAATAAARSLAAAAPTTSTTRSNSPARRANNSGTHFERARQREAAAAQRPAPQVHTGEYRLFPTIVSAPLPVRTSSLAGVTVTSHGAESADVVAGSGSNGSDGSNGGSGGRRKGSIKQTLLDFVTPKEDMDRIRAAREREARIGVSSAALNSRPSTPAAAGSRKGSLSAKLADIFVGEKRDRSSSSRRGSAASSSNVLRKPQPESSGVEASRPSSPISLRGFRDMLTPKTEAQREADRHERQRSEQLALAHEERIRVERMRAQQITEQVARFDREEEAALERDRARAERMRKREEERLAALLAREEAQAPANAGHSLALGLLEGVDKNGLLDKINVTPPTRTFPKGGRFIEADDVYEVDTPGQYIISTSTPYADETPAYQGKGKAPARSPGFFDGAIAAAGKISSPWGGSKAKRPDSDMSFADVGVPGTMTACLRCGRVPEGAEWLTFGQCKNCHPDGSISRRSSASSFSSDHNPADKFDGPTQGRTSYMYTPDGRYQAIRKTKYDDPGNPFGDEDDDVSPVPSTYSPSSFYGKMDEGEARPHPWRQMSLRRKSYSAAKGDGLQALPESGPVKVGLSRPVREPMRASSDNVVVNSTIFEDDNAGEYVPPRAHWRRASAADDVRSPASPRDSAFYGFYDDLIEGRGKRDTVAQSMRRRPSYF